MSKLIQTQGPLLALLVLVLLFSIFSENFASLPNLAAVLEAAAIPAIVAIGMTFVLMQASIDLSVEGVASFANILLSITVANSVTATDIGLWAIPLVIGTGALIGATSSIISIYVRMPSLIVTLGMWLTTVGLAALAYPGRLPQILDTRITALAIEKQWGLSWIVYLVLALIVAAVLVEKHTRFGRLSRAIGENETVLIMAGHQGQPPQDRGLCPGRGLLCPGGQSLSARASASATRPRGLGFSSPQSRPAFWAGLCCPAAMAACGNP